MTLSILASDCNRQIIGGASTTGSLCVGGWVLRGAHGVGMSASQGASPSTFWGEESLTALKQGLSAEQAIETVTRADTGRAYRQLGVMDCAGNAAAHDGDHNTPEIASLKFDRGMALGNMLSSKSVVEAMVEGFERQSGFVEKLLSALEAGTACGGDVRGVTSAAILVFFPDAAPLTLRVDYSETPIEDLKELYQRSQSGIYGEWLNRVPNPRDPYRY